ncbi:MAG: site-specific DNA-methyltransferase [Candidatus Saccharimonadales bacterium]
MRDDESGGKLVKNTETNGRYHSDWLSMMQERLIVARDLLSDDGVIFISIDDNEAAHLLGLCDGIFGENSRVGVMKRRAARKSANLSKSMSDVCDYVAIYCKSDELGSLSVETISDSTRPVFNAGNKITLRKIPNGTPARCEDGTYAAGDYIATSMTYSLKDAMVVKEGMLAEDVQVEGPWRVNQDLLNQTIFITKNGGFRRTLLPEEYGKVKVMNDLLDNSRFYNENGTEETTALFDNKKIFDTPKPVDLIKHLVLASSDFGDNQNMIILDFFSGSSTTAHAVMQLNAEDGGNRKHIQVQLAEATDPASEAYKAGYKTIPEISRERIRRAAAKIREDYAEQIAKRDTPLDTGFRAYKLSSSNFTDVRLHPSEALQTTLLGTTDTIKLGRSAEDLLTEVTLSLGLTLDLPIEQRDIAGHTVYFVGGNSLVACFDDTVSLDIVDAIGREKPLLVAFKDSSFASDEVRINVDIRLKQFSTDIKVKVL